MKVFEKRQGENRETDLASAIAESVQITHGQEGELERIRSQINQQAEAFGKLFAYVIEGDHSQAAKLALVGEVLSYRFELVA